ncbi:receptor-like protein EIX2 [Bidens hawaiensis]|uniref:receptor-like protein EIX2 n=1 Tax=Bidens hawaiensis TaxID=980011 RepID=UPI00404A04DD
MGNTLWGLEIRLVFICIFLVTVTRECVGGGNLTAVSCSEQERLALLEFKHSATYDQGMFSSWGVGNDCCRWKGVGCDDVTGRVVSLHLRNEFGITEQCSSFGAIEVNSCLTGLVYLKHLDLSGNDFQQSQIPEFIGSLKQLRYLNLSNTNFIGNVPYQIGNLSNLKVLDLSNPYELTIDDFEWISGLSKLEHLDLSGVILSRTKNLDNLFYAIPSLLNLRLSYCGLSMAKLHSQHLNSSRKLASIKHLDLSGNDFQAQLPGIFMNMTSLEFLDLSYNDLGTLSMAWRFQNLLNRIPYVSVLSLQACSIQKINLSPTNLSFSTSSNIQHLDLSINIIEGIFPLVLTNMSNLLSLDLSGNKLDSSIPTMPSLLKLNINENSFRRIEDVGIWRHCHLKELIVTYNNLRGEMISPSTNVSKCSQNELEILKLDDNALSGSIPDSLARLTNLRSLDLSFNKLTGPIPESLGKLRSLQVVYLSYNLLIGPIPEFYGQLTILHLAYNNLSGCIPESLGNLTTLKDIFLKSNRFTGSIPVSLGRLISLRVFSVSSNLLNGTIPSTIGQLTKLYILDVSNNSLQGLVLEDHFANLSMLRYLNADSNNLFFNISHEWIPPFQLQIVHLVSCKIEGGFPQWFRTQRNLYELVMSNASLSGPLPAWLRLMRIMHFLDLSHNKLTGPLTNLPYLFEGELNLQDNLFRGLIPRSLCKNTYLNVLDLSKNRLSGKIPKCLWNTYLSVMVLSSNRLSGVIPNPLGYSSLRLLQLNDNNINGELPRDFGYFKSLEVLDLGENKISGNIPKWIGENITLLSALRLHKNNFTGRIPHSLCKLQQLHILDLAHNTLIGSIPHCFGELGGMKDSSHVNSSMVSGYFGNMMQVLKGAELEYTRILEFVRNIDLSSNKFSGEIPETLTTLDALLGLNLGNNHFSGGIPKSIGNIKSLISLDLSANELSGMIPPSVAALNFLSYLNLSHNNLSGQIPTGNQLQTLTDPSIHADNTYLCGALVHKECYPHEKPPPTTSKNKQENASEPTKVWFYLDIMSGFTIGFWGIIGVLLFKKQWRHRLFMLCEETIDDIHVAVMVTILKMKRGREAA